MRVDWSAGFSLGYEHVRNDWARAVLQFDQNDRNAFTVMLMSLLVWSEPETFLEDAELVNRSPEDFLEGCRKAMPDALDYYASVGLGLYRERLARGNAPIRSGPHVGRNDPCPCGSGRKFKNCCLN